MAIVLTSALVITASAAFAADPGNGGGRIPSTLTQDPAIQTNLDNPKTATPVDPVNPVSYPFEQNRLMNGAQYGK